MSDEELAELEAQLTVKVRLIASLNAGGPRSAERIRRPAYAPSGGR